MGNIKCLQNTLPRKTKKRGEMCPCWDTRLLQNPVPKPLGGELDTFKACDDVFLWSTQMCLQSFPRLSVPQRRLKSPPTVPPIPLNLFCKGLSVLEMPSSPHQVGREMSPPSLADLTSQPPHPLRALHPSHPNHPEDVQIRVGRTWTC